MTDRKILRFLILLAVGLFLTVIFLFYRTTVLDSQLHTLGRSYRHHLNPDYKPDKFLQFRQFKEDSYITQQSRDTTLILSVFAAIVGLTAFFTYRISKDEVSLIVEKFTTKMDIITTEINAAIAEHKGQTDKAQKFLEETRRDFNFEVYMTRMQASRDCKDSNKSLSIFLGLTALTYLAGYYVHQKKYKERPLKELEDKFDKHLKEIFALIGDDIFTMTGIDKANVDGCIYAILNTQIPGTSGLLFAIKEKLTYPTS
jgi:hypothetical protein